ncbi:hypothetical protein [Streptomyces sp. NPDC101165]|uniref:hypothetical protein n=1 Tax=Streptomyces sp. NPDC101165 TaxID=3366119 RepID=UPI003808E23E
MQSTGGLGASAWVRSPAEAAADTGPPTPTVLTARVVHQRITSATVFRGTFTASGTVSFTPRGLRSRRTAPRPPGAPATPLW